MECGSKVTGACVAPRFFGNRTPPGPFASILVISNRVAKPIPARLPSWHAKCDGGATEPADRTPVVPQGHVSLPPASSRRMRLSSVVTMPVSFPARHCLAFRLGRSLQGVNATNQIVDLHLHRGSSSAIAARMRLLAGNGQTCNSAGQCASA